jgi:hypothetical protein
MRFRYLGPPGEPRVFGTHAFGVDWVRGVPQEISDPAILSRLAVHPHFAAEVEAEGAGEGDELPPAPKRRGRPPKVSDDGGSAGL